MACLTNAKINVCGEILTTCNKSHLGWSTLYHQVHFRDVQSTGCDIGGNQNLKRTVPEALQRHLSLFLRNISMENLATLIRCIQNELRNEHCTFPASSCQFLLIKV